MHLTRRESALLLGAAALPLRAATAWTAEYDQAILRNSLKSMDVSYDPAEQMLARKVGNDYSYHSAIRSGKVHPTRDSLEYALSLLEAGRGERAFAVIARTIHEQDTDPQSRFYGIWGWYMEEPARVMNPADFNWADFNGSLLLLIEFRHGKTLPPALRKQVLESIHHAAYSVRKRNVSMGYTNIAAQGTFVTLAAGKLLDDRTLWEYAVDRQRRFAAKIEETGSFAEYNSPTYANVTIVNLSRIATYIQDEQVLSLNAQLHERIWRHLGNHWHATTRQLAGPMSRCYSTDIGKPLWLQKALNNELEFATLDDLRVGRSGASAEVAITNYHCPPQVAPLFVKPATRHQYRETFLPGVQGTTWFDKEYCLGSVNRGEFWIQRRPLLAYWRPSHFAQLRFMKDDYDFSSALLYATQEENRILGVVNFRSPGGDKHISIDMVKNGQFEARSLRLQLDISDPAAEIRVDGLQGTVDSFGLSLNLHVHAGTFGSFKPALQSEKGKLIVHLVKTDAQQLIRWTDVQQAYLAFTFSIGAPVETPFSHRLDASAKTIQCKWGELELTAGTRVDTLANQERAFRESRNGKAVELQRLS